MKTFNQLLLTDPTIRTAFEAGMSTQELVCLVAHQRDCAWERALKLDEIVPRKYKMPDGSVFIWRCPDDLVPVAGE